ncbi:MAG: hcaD [Clostridiales bacterium]|jgi:rhodanese-related sulfurtransferase|nr:hcaD [Clostridiales bacterium]
MWFKEISIKEALNCLKKKNCIFVDVRTKQEYNEGHIKGAINIPFDSLEIKKDLPLRGNEIVVYCQVGTRGIRAARLLESLGYRVVNLSGGYLNWTGEVEKN